VQERHSPSKWFLFLSCQLSVSIFSCLHNFFPQKRKSLRQKTPACIKERLSTSAHTSQSPTEIWKKGKQQRLMRIWQVVSHAIRPAPSPPEASRSTSNFPIRSLFLSEITVFVWDCILCLVFEIMFLLFIAWQCSAVANWCTLCKGMPRFSRGVMVYWL